MRKTETIEARAAAIDLEVGHRIRERRKAKGLTQTQMGDLLGVSFQQVQKYERGTNRVSSSTLMLIAEALECPPAELLGSGELFSGDGSSALNDFLASPYGPRMMRAFVRLQPAHAKHLADMAEMLAAAHETLESAAA